VHEGPPGMGNPAHMGKKGTAGFLRASCAQHVLPRVSAGYHGGKEGRPGAIAVPVGDSKKTGEGGGNSGL